MPNGLSESGLAPYLVRGAARVDHKRKSVSVNCSRQGFLQVRRHVRQGAPELTERTSIPFELRDTSFSNRDWDRRMPRDYRTERDATTQRWYGGNPQSSNPRPCRNWPQGLITSADCFGVPMQVSSPFAPFRPLLSVEIRPEQGRLRRPEHRRHAGTRASGRLHPDTRAHPK